MKPYAHTHIATCSFAYVHAIPLPAVRHKVTAATYAMVCCQSLAGRWIRLWSALLSKLMPSCTSHKAELKDWLIMCCYSRRLLWRWKTCLSK